MACTGLIGCKHTQSTGAGSGYYVLMALVILVTMLGIRILLYSITRCIQMCQGDEEDDEDHEFAIEMRNINNMLAMHHRHPRQQQQLRSSSSLVVNSPQLMLGGRDDQWQSKLVIVAGDDHVSCIAHPCPFQGSAGQIL